MRPEILQSELVKILESSFVPKGVNDVAGTVLKLSDAEMFQLWNMLGEELGIDLALATPDQRRILLESCENGRRLLPTDFGSLLWLVYYGDSFTH